MSQAQPDHREDTFDRFAHGYSGALDEAVSLSGESAEYFTQLKIELIGEMLGEKRHQPGLRFLDYGCGTGRAAVWIERMFAESDYVGVDASRQSVLCACEHVQGPRAVFMTLEEFAGQRPGPFSVALAAVVFHHIPVSERPATVARIYQLLEPGGAFFVFEHNPVNPLTRRVVNSCPFDEDAELLHASETVALLAAAGFDPIRTRYYFFFPRILRRFRALERYLSWNPLGAQYAVLGWKPGGERRNGR